MEPVPPLSIGARIIAEFEDDAGAAPPGPTPLGTRAQTVSAEAMQVDAACVSPTEEAAARRFWVEVIRRHTEAVPGSAGRLRVIGSAAPNRGVIVVEQAQAEDGPAVLRQGCELDTADALCLTFIDREAAEPGGVKESAKPIPWSEIRNLRFEVFRPRAPSAG